MRSIFVSLLLFPTVLLAGNDNNHHGGRSAGLGHTSVTLSDVWSTHHNQAGLGWLTNPEMGVFYQNRFLIKEMSYMGGAFALPTNSGTFGLSYSNFGYSLYGESKTGLAYGMKFSDRVAGGIQVNYHSIRLGNNYGSRNTASVELGLQSKITQQLSIGCHVFNPTQSKLDDYNDERIPTIIRLGLNYAFSDKVFLAIETEKDIDFNPVFRAGIEYKANDKIYFRGGIGTNPTLAAFGVGINHQSFKIDIASTYHQVLGFTPEISLNYQIDKK